MSLTQVQGGMILPSTTLTTPIVSTTLGVGGATPSTSGAGITFPATQSGTAKYFAMGSQYSSTTVNGVIPFPVTMRANPTSASSSGTNYYVFYRNATGDDFNSITIEGASPQQTGFFNNTEISGTAGQAGTIYAQNASAFIAFQAEL